MKKERVTRHRRGDLVGMNKRLSVCFEIPFVYPVAFIVLSCAEGNRARVVGAVRETCPPPSANYCLKAHTVEDEGKNNLIEGRREILGRLLLLPFPHSAVPEKKMCW